MHEGVAVIERYTSRHVKIDVCIGVAGMFPGLAQVALISAIALQSPVIYQPLVREIAKLYERPGGVPSTMVRRAAIGGAGFDVAAQFGVDFLKECARDLVVDQGIGLGLTWIPVAGGLFAAALDAVIARKMTRLVGAMALVYFENANAWIESRKKTRSAVLAALKTSPFASVPDIVSELLGPRVAAGRAQTSYQVGRYAAGDIQESIASAWVDCARWQIPASGIPQDEACDAPSKLQLRQMKAAYHAYRRMTALLREKPKVWRSNRTSGGVLHTGARFGLGHLKPEFPIELALTIGSREILRAMNREISPSEAIANITVHVGSRVAAIAVLTALAAGIACAAGTAAVSAPFIAGAAATGAMTGEEIALELLSLRLPAKAAERLFARLRQSDAGAGAPASGGSAPVS